MHYEKTENKIVFRMKTWLFTGPFSSEEQPMWTLNAAYHKLYFNVLRGSNL